MGAVWMVRYLQFFAELPTHGQDTQFSDMICYFIAFVVISTYGAPMNISLTPELEQMVHDKVKSGRYASASEVIREGLRLLEEQEQLKQQRLADVRRKIDRGIEQLDRGEGIPGPEARARLRRTRSVK
jgi:antitoxin ParD1/3/4